MQSIKPGRGPSSMEGAAGVVAVLFGIGWTVIAYNMTRNAPFGFAVVFPLFGVAFVILGIIRTLYAFKNATGRNRMSVFDITTEAEEPDPLNREFGVKQSMAGPGVASIEERLAHLEILRSQGTISESEYVSQRKRVLDEL